LHLSQARPRWAVSAVSKGGTEFNQPPVNSGE
jgi:hypothetical protein